MLKNFWYACELSSAIANQPKPLTLLGQNVVLYRDSQGEIVAFKDRCAHRGAALSGGRVERDCIRCPYHGWKYRADGTCVEIPANLPTVPIPQKARIETYPVLEKYGWVWLFVGDLSADQAPPLPSLPEFDDPAFRVVYGELRWEAHYTRVVENALDISHTSFIHAKSMGSGMADNPQMEEYDLHLEDWGASATVTAIKPKTTRGSWKSILKKQGSRPVRVTLACYMPNITRLEFEFASGNFKYILFSSHLPVDVNTTASQWLVLRNFFTVPWADRDTRQRTLRIMLEDKPVVESQSPTAIPYDLAAELHVASDALSVAYRQLRKKYLDMGWGIDAYINSSDARKDLRLDYSPGRGIKEVSLT